MIVVASHSAGAEHTTQVLVAVAGVTLAVCVQFIQLNTVRLYGVHGALHQCRCQAVHARRCLPIPPQCSLRTAVCSCHIISGGGCIFCHIPLHAQQYMCTLWVWMTKWDAYLDLTISACVSACTHEIWVRRICFPFPVTLHKIPIPKVTFTGCFASP